jgi:hypothetical protein
MARKYAAVYDIAVANGFLAPKVLEVRSGSVILERLGDMAPLESLYLTNDPGAIDPAITRAGEVLALLHNNLPRADAVRWSPPPGFMDEIARYLGRRPDIRSLPDASLHGDYSFANVWVTRDNPRSIVIIDPCANFGSTFDDWTVGPIFVDIGKMLACLEGQVALRRQHRRPSSTRINDLQRRFIDGYGRFGSRPDMETSNAFAFAVSSAQFYRRFGRASAIHRFALYNRFKGNFPSYRKQRQVR